MSEVTHSSFNACVETASRGTIIGSSLNKVLYRTFFPSTFFFFALIFFKCFHERLDTKTKDYLTCKHRALMTLVSPTQPLTQNISSAFEAPVCGSFLIPFPLSPGGRKIFVFTLIHSTNVLRNSPPCCGPGSVLQISDKTRPSPPVLKALSRQSLQFDVMFSIPQ